MKIFRLYKYVLLHRLNMLFSRSLVMLDSANSLQTQIFMLCQHFFFICQVSSDPHVLLLKSLLKIRPKSAEVYANPRNDFLAKTSLFVVRFYF